jgi:aspartate oxidase
MAQSHAGVVKARHDYDSAAAIDHATSSTPSNVRDAAKKIIRQDASKREIDNLKDVQKRHQGIERASKKLAKEEAQIDEKLNMDKASMGDVVKDFKDSNAPQFKGKSPAKRRVMAIAAKLTAERGGKPLNKEERLQNRLTDISESHQRVMLEVFDKLNEDNKSKFLEACSTPDGVDQMLDFAIRHRGE